MVSRGVIFQRALRDARAGILGWGLMLGFFGFLVISLFPQIEGLLEAFGPLLDSPVIKPLVGNIEEFASLEGFLGVKLFSMLPLILAVYVVLFALGIVAGEEERGTLDILLSTPASRPQVVLEKYAAMIVALVGMLALMLVGMMLGAATLPDFPLTAGQLLAALVNLLPITFLMASFTLLLSTVLRSRNTAGAIASGVIFGSYFLTTLAEMAGDAVEQIKYLSFYQYYNGGTIFIEGIHWPSFLGLLLGAVVFLAAGVFFFQRRDLRGG
ncbi:MAG: ABC transporter permease subunit [Anaerolineae bacterium]|nr:ABC transporter permease subunit [Anaerolineae bacterium]